ncbi:MAG: autotransporter domain-containing protein [Rhizobiales bacterium]|nr:autotransporter domain-containing protein [Hyphomicrobiales bacterium]
MQLRPRPERAWLLRGTALAGGVLAASFLAPSSQAWAAACLQNLGGPGNSVDIIECAGTDTSTESFTVNGGATSYTVNLGPALSPSNYVQDVNTGGTAFTINANGISGVLQLYSGSHVINQNGNGFVLTNLGATVSYTVDGRIEGGAAADADTSTYRSGDGLRVQGGKDVTIILTKDGVLQGADDGLVVTAASTKLTITNNGGTINGRGLSNDQANDSEGILVSSTGYKDGQVTGPITITNNSGDITGHANVQQAGNGGGYGISAASTQNIIIDNLVTTIGDAPTITGAGGIYAYGSKDVTITNYGHIAGITAAGVTITGGAGGGVAKVVNHSYGSVMGTHGDDISNMAQTIAENGGGLTIGLSGDGLHIRNITGALNANDPAVHVINNRQDLLTQSGGGVIGGYWDGIDIDGVGGTTGTTGTKVVVDNGGYWDNQVPSQFHQGGLVYGKNGQGIDIGGTHGDVVIHNEYTLFDTIPLANITDADGKAFLDNDLVTIATDLTGSATPVLPTGIIGKTDGIRLVDIGDGSNAAYAEIDNYKGLILGYQGNGINIDGVSGYHNTSNGADEYVGVNLDNQHGLILGVSLSGLSYNLDGLHYRNIDGSVNTDDRGGIIAGLDDGAYIRNVSRGNVWFGTDGGIIAGLDHAIDVRGVTGETIGSTLYGGNAFVENGDFQGTGDPDNLNYNPDWSQGGGLILGGTTAISLRDIGQQAWIGNGSGGWILGDGSRWNAPVISLNASQDQYSGGSYIDNYGVMSSYDIFNAVDPNIIQLLTDLSTFSVGPTTDTASLLPYIEGIMNVQQIFSDMGDLNAYVRSGGSSGSIDNLANYSDAAADLLVKSNGKDNGLTGINNYNLMVGRLYLDGHDDAGNGNSVTNYGTWLTRGTSTFNGGPNDWISNYGLIQTAFDAEKGAHTEFKHVNDFYNGLSPGGYMGISPGILSMIDGGAGDRTTVDGNFHGGYLGQSVSSYVAIDAYFLPDGSGGKSDRLSIKGDVDGSTGLIINQVDTWNGISLSDDGTIKVISVKGIDDNWNTDASKTCFGTLCKYGDTFFIASQSQGYVGVSVQGGGTAGAVQTGLDHAWYLTEQPSNGGSPPDPDFYLVSGAAPNGVQTAGLTTGAQNIFYDASGLVEDHVYGMHFPLIGSGGADLPADGGGASSGGEKTGLWAKIGGSWDNQESSVNQTIMGSGVTIDTSFDQNTYSVLGGGDFSPTGEGNGFRFGLYGGYTQSDLDFNSYGASASYKGGIVGGYAAYTSGGFYADAQLNANFLNVDYNAPALGAGVTASADSTSVGVLANTGYRIQNGWGFIEPIVSLNYVNTSIGSMTGGNATVDFSNGQSLQAGAGGRIGTTFGTPGGTKTEVSLLGKVWNEFEDANTVTITDNLGNTASFSDSISGVFGEIAATATIYAPNRAWSSFVTGGAKFNSDFTSWNAKAGIRTAF